MKNMLKDAVILFAITLISGVILGFVYQITKNPISAQKDKAKTEAYAEVFAAADSFEAVEDLDTEYAYEVIASCGYTEEDINEVAVAKDAGGNQLGYVITVTTHEGYGGDIQFSMGVCSDGTLNGISLLSISETAGLGMKAEEVLKPQFNNKQVEKFEYTKTGAVTDDQIDAISGATITTNAVTNGVDAGLAYFQNVLNVTEGGSGNE